MPGKVWIGRVGDALNRFTGHKFALQFEVTSRHLSISTATAKAAKWEGHILITHSVET